MTVKKKHKAILNVQIMVHPLDEKTGECERSLEQSVLNQYGIKPKQLLTLTGFDMHDCLAKLKRLLDEFGK